MCHFVHTDAPNIACFHHLTCGKEDTLLVAFIEFSSIWECCGHMWTAQSLAVQSKALPSYHHWPAVRGSCVSTSADTHFTPHELSDNCSKLETLYTEFDLMRIRWNTCGPRISVPLLPVVSFVTCDRHPLTPYPPHGHPHHSNISHLCIHSLAVAVSELGQFCASLYTIVLYNVDCVGGSVAELLFSASLSTICTRCLSCVVRKTCTSLHQLA